MGSKAITPQDYFEKSVETLFMLGQFPVILITLLFTNLVAQLHGIDSATWYWTLALILGPLAVALSLVALLYRKRYQKNSVCFLTFSLICTLGYLSCLIMITGGRKSPFMHLFLYLPVIVFMVAERRVWAEIVASVGSLICFCVTYDPGFEWKPWQEFSVSKNFNKYEMLFIGILLVLLILVNHTVETLIKEKLPVVPPISK